MSDPTTRPTDATDAQPTEDDTEGQAFSWSVVDDPKKGKRLHQTYTPDEPKKPRPHTADDKPSGAR